MPIPTINLAIDVYQITGAALANAQVELVLTRADIVDATGELVPAGRTLVQADESGHATPAVFPNALGRNGTQYGVRVYDESGAQVFPEKAGEMARASLPDSDVALHACLFNIPPLSRTDADAAILLARAWANQTGSAVQDGEYSAKHYAEVAQTVATDLGDLAAALAAADADAAAAAASATAAAQAKTDAQAAAAAAAASEAQTLTYRNETQGFRNEAEGFKDAASASATAASNDAAAALAHKNATELLAQGVDADATAINAQVAQVEAAKDAASGFAAAANQHRIDAQQAKADTDVLKGETQVLKNQTADDRAAVTTLRQETEDWAVLASGHANNSENSANESAEHAADADAVLSNALALYGSAQALTDALTQAQASGMTATAAASAAYVYSLQLASAVSHDLSGVISQPLYLGPGTPMVGDPYFVSKDSDPTWPLRCQNASWRNEEVVPGAWLGWQFSETAARMSNATLGDELVTNGGPSITSTTGWTPGASNSLSTSAGRLKVTAVAGNGNDNGNQSFAVVAGKVHRLRVGHIQAFDSSGAIDPSGRARVTVSVGAGALTILTSSGSGSRLFPTNGGAGYVYFTVSVDTNLFVTAETASNAAYAPAGYYGLFGDISVKEVTAIHTGSGDYYGNSSDGKFYALNAGTYVPGGALPGVTETKRGNKRDFPLGGVGRVWLADRVILFDLGEEGCPMWMVFERSANSTHKHLGPNTANVNDVQMGEGYMVVATAVALTIVDFVRDRTDYQNQVSSGQRLGNIAQRNDGLGVLAEGTGPLNSNVINAAAMCVMPDAPVDQRRGLQQPTIAVGTGSGLSIIQNDGTVRNSSTAGSWLSVAITPQLVIGYVNSVFYYASKPNSLGAGFTPSNFGSGVAPGFNPSGNMGGVAMPRRDFIVARGNTLGQPQARMMKFNEADPAKSLVAYLSDTYATGWWAGDVRSCLGGLKDAGTLDGAELINDGSFSGGTVPPEWQLNGTTPIVNGSGQIETAGWIYYPLTVEVGKTYQLSYEWVTKNGSGRVLLGNSASSAATQYLNDTTAGAGVTQTVTVKPTQTTIYLMIGDIGGTALNVYDNLSFREVVPDRSYKAKPAQVHGTLAVSPVAPGSQLQAIGPFSDSNYIRQAYNAERDALGYFTPGLVNIPAATAMDPAKWPVLSAPALSAWTNHATTGFNNFSTSGGTQVSAEKTVGGGTATANLGPSFAIAAGEYWRITAVIASQSGAAGAFGLALMNGSNGRSVNVSGQLIQSGASTYTVIVRVTNSDPAATIGLQSAAVAAINITSVTAEKVGNAVIESRRAAAGPYAVLSHDPEGKLSATLSDGTTTTTATTTNGYAGAGYVEPVVVNHGGGKVGLNVGGREAASATGTALGSMVNAAAVLTIGNSFALDAPFQGTIALLEKWSATVPSAEALEWMAAQHRAMCQPGAQVCLPDSGALTGLDVDKVTGTVIAQSAAYRSEFAGCVRVSATASPSGSYSGVAADNGYRLTVRTGGVYVTIPPQTLRDALARTAEEAARRARPLVRFNFTLNAGESQVALPPDYEAEQLFAAGLLRDEGAADYYQRPFDGFRERPTLNTPVGATTKVSVFARRTTQ